ncbi:MAG: epoxide hydrolase [Gammaproteobacteria bacterium]|nr:MAG: epoxide hydrolase [Gammaproteobacteria bacterium]
MSDAVTPFTIKIQQAELDDLAARLDRVRWPDQETPGDWSQGIPLAYVHELVSYWREQYDWRRAEALLNSFDQFRTTVDGLGIHFLHVRSPHEQARPLLITHGWPGSVLEFHKVIGPLTDPVAYGGDAGDAFHVVCPSLPGYGFSDKPTQPGWGVEKIAEAWDTLMRRLGYEHYFAQGGDWGAMVTTMIGIQNKGACEGIHLNMAIAPPDPETMDDLSAAEQSALAGMKHYQDWDSGYSKQQATRPQTLGYGLADSPVGQAAWIIEKFWSWMDCDGHPENVLTRDELLDNVMIYWLNNAAASSARLYWESFGSVNLEPVSLPTGITIFPKEIFRTSRRWADKRFTHIVHFSEQDKGGHFAAFERPEVFVDEVRATFRTLRG